MQRYGLTLTVRGSDKETRLRFGTRNWGARRRASCRPRGPGRPSAPPSLPPRPPRRTADRPLAGSPGPCGQPEGLRAGSPPVRERQAPRGGPPRALRDWPPEAAAEAAAHCLRRTASYGKREETDAARPAPAVCACARPRRPAAQSPRPPAPRKCPRPVRPRVALPGGYGTPTGRGRAGAGLALTSSRGGAGESRRGRGAVTSGARAELWLWWRRRR